MGSGSSKLTPEVACRVVASTHCKPETQQLLLVVLVLTPCS